MKAEFLSSGPPISGISMKFLFSRLQSIQELPKLSDSQLQYLFTHSKMLVLAYGNSRIAVQSDIQRHERLLFTEFLIFICLVANETFSQERVNGVQITFLERLTRFLKHFFQEFGEDYVDTE